MYVSNISTAINKIDYWKPITTIGILLITLIDLSLSISLSIYLVSRQMTMMVSAITAISEE